MMGAMKQGIGFAIAVGFVASMAAAARADDDVSGDTVGHFPLARLGLVGGFDFAPVPYADLSGAPDTHDDFGGVLAPELELHLDTQAMLVNLTGVYNVVGGNVGWMGRAEIVMGKVLGLRTTHNVIKSISDSAPDSSGEYTRTTETYVHLHVPMYFGVSAAASVWGVGEVSYTAPSYTVPEGVTNTRSAAVVPAVDVGLTLQSPQLELSVGPLLELSTGSWGLHWAYGMGLPIGDRLLWFRFTGDHVLGSDELDNSGRRMGTTMMFAMGMSTGLGLGL
jgi:hypothetical protein